MAKPKTPAATPLAEPIKALSKKEVLAAMQQNVNFLNQRARMDATPAEFHGLAQNFTLVQAALQTLPDLIKLA